MKTSKQEISLLRFASSAH